MNMTKTQEKERQTMKQATDIAAHGRADIFADVLPFIYRMRQYERQLQKLAEHSCNGYPKPTIEYRDGKMYSYSVEDTAWRERCEKREAKIEKAIIAYAAQFFLVPDFQGDPRGVMFELKNKEGRTFSFWA